MQQNTTGVNNTASGRLALYSNTTGANNIALGYQAGRFQADGSTALTNASSSVYLGASSRGFSTTDFNSIVIGASSIGGGENTAVLGNDSITRTLLKGNVIINAITTNSTTTPTGCVGCLVIASSTAPSAMTANSVALFAVDITGSHELRVMDEASNITTLSPHNFSQFTPDPDAILPWSYASENNKKDLAINVDMYGLAQTVEALSGKRLIYAKYMKTGEVLDRRGELIKAVGEIEKTRTEEKVVNMGKSVDMALGGVQTKDLATGEMYCMAIENGAVVSKKGLCSSLVLPITPSSTTSPESVPSVSTPVTPSSTEPAIEPTPSSTEPAPSTILEQAPTETAPLAPAVEPAPITDITASTLGTTYQAGSWFANLSPIRATINLFTGFGSYVLNGFTLRPR